MDKKKKSVKIIAILCIVAVGIVALYFAELGVNVVYRDLRLKNAEAPVYESADAVGLDSYPILIKAEENVPAAAVLWVAAYYKVGDTLDETKIAEETNVAFSECKFYDALEKYMPNRRREQLRCLPDGKLLEKTYEMLKAKRPVIATVASGAGVTYSVVVGMNPAEDTVTLYRLETATEDTLTTAEFLQSMKFAAADGATKSKLFFGDITKNGILIV